MLKCMECSYTTDDNDKKYCPYDGSKLVEVDNLSTDINPGEFDDDFDDYN